MATINYADKVALDINPDIADINKVNASDMNLLKQVGNQTLKTIGVFTDDWSSSATYAVKDIVIYDNRVFENLTGNNTATPPDQDTTNWEETTIAKLSAGVNIPIQNTAPENPEEDDLWIDTSEPEEMQEAIVNEYSESINEAYSCDYANKYYGGVELYSNNAGSSSEITLSDSISNYSRIKIFFTSTVEGCYEFIPQNTAVKIGIGSIYKTGSLFIQTIGTYSCNGNKLTPQLEECGYYSISNNAIQMHWDNTNYCSIKKVIGYK